MIFLANWYWPLLVLLIYFITRESSLFRVITFWQVYILSTPHRWITLALVFLDRQRMQERRGTFLGLAALFTVIVLACSPSLEALAALVAIDFMWNAWHFASQHSGISRIYSRLSRPEDASAGTLEKSLLRLFVIYTIFRLVADFVYPVRSTHYMVYLEWLVLLMDRCRQFDLWLLLLPAWLLMRDLGDFRWAMRGRLAYLSSVLALYSALLLTVHYQATAWTTGLLLAIAVFHATEYLAIASWSIHKRHGSDTEGIWAGLVPRWTLTLSLFMAGLGLSAWMFTANFFRAWLVVTLVVGFLHYAYDGIIWKAPRRPASAS